MNGYKRKYILNNIMKESVLDTTKGQLNSDIFVNNKMKTEVGDFIVSIIREWCLINIPEANIDNVILIGSSAGYNYNDSSDIDINVTLSDINEARLKEVTKILPNGNFLFNTKHPINYYLTLNNDNVEIADNAYDLLNDEWIKKPQKNDIKIPIGYAFEIAKLFISGIDNRIMEYETDVKEMEYYKQLLKNKEKIDDNEINERISIKEEEIKADLDALYIAHRMIRAFRGESFDKETKTSYLIEIKNDSPNYTINNIVYKILENAGYFDKLIKLEKLRKN